MYVVCIRELFTIYTSYNYVYIQKMLRNRTQGDGTGVSSCVGEVLVTDCSYLFEEQDDEEEHEQTG